MRGFSGRVVLVTGGGTGIGRALAAAFHQEGANVAIASRDPRHLAEAAAAIQREGTGGGAAAGSDRLMSVPLDVRLSQSAQTAARTVASSWARIDVLINNAGVSGRSPILDDGEKGAAFWEDVIGTNLMGLYHMTRAALPLMPEGGRVINISSVLGKFGVAGYSAYCASKHGAIGFTRALAAELAPRRITVNAICPGWVDTAMAERGVRETAAALGITPSQFQQQAMERVPLGRFLEPAEVAPLALYLASEAAAGMTGQAINIEGGATTW